MWQMGVGASSGDMHVVPSKVSARVFEAHTIIAYSPVSPIKHAGIEVIY
jgi:hypothetical protein